MVTERANIPISEQWRRVNWKNFDTVQAITDDTQMGRTSANPGVDPGLDTQDHIDLRTCDINESWVGDDTYSVGRQSVINNWTALVCDIPNSDSGTEQTITSTMAPIDLTALGSDATLVLTLPYFPTTALNLGLCFLDLSSDGFDTTICSLPWTGESLHAESLGGMVGLPLGSHGDLTTFDLAGPYTLAGGVHLPLSGDIIDFSSTSDSVSAVANVRRTSDTSRVHDHIGLIPSGSGNHVMLSWPLAMITGVNLKSITDVRIRVVSTAGCIVLIAALRLIGPGWVQTNVDFDNLHGRLYQTIPLNGDPDAIVPANALLPTVWRSSAISGIDDPRPIDAELGFLFNTGSQNAANLFSIFMRENNEPYTTQLSLNDMPQSALTGQPQPVTQPTEYEPRTMGDLDQLTMSDLDTQTMVGLEKTIGPGQNHYIDFSLQWGSNAGIAIGNSAGGSTHQFSNLGLQSNTTYLATCKLTDTTARLAIYMIHQDTFEIIQPIYDTTLIEDDYLFPRLPGRIGFFANINDGDSWVGAIRPRSLMFAEYRSRPLNSFTPVSGAHLFVSASPDVELFSQWSAVNDGSLTPTLVVDQQRYAPDDPQKQSIRVTISEPSSATPTQGIISNILSPPNDAFSGITDFEHLEIDFDVWMPSTAMVTTIDDLPILTASLISSEGAVLPLNLPPITGDQWTSIRLVQPFSAPWPMSDLYQLQINYNGQVGTAWWIGNVSVHETTIAWYGRSVASDPWHANYAPWTPFYDTLNSNINGAQFTTRGSSLQIRGQAYRQNAVILNAPTVVPEYAELGNLVWPEDASRPPSLSAPTVNVYYGNNRTVTFDGRSGTASDPIRNYHWAFGDGTYGTGGIVTHTYPSWIASGVYVVMLTVIDAAGQIISTPTQATIV